MTQNQIVKADEATIKQMLYQPDTLAQFESILGKSSARHYVGSVFLAVANSPELQDCHPESIIRSAMRCAALELSCDPVAKQGQLVPFWNSKKGRKDAQLIVHYKGLSLLAQRSGLYRHCNVSEVFKGYEVEKDILTGIHSVKFNKDEFDASKVIGYLGYFETKSGFKKTVYWTIEEIKAHASKFAPKNPLYNPSSPHYKTMLEKTVWRDLLSWADLGGGNSASRIEAALEEVDDDFIDPQDLPAIEAEEITEEAAPRSEAQNLKDLGFTDDEPKQPAPAPAEEPATEDFRATHAALWKKASAAGFINSETAKLWAINNKMTPDEVAQKCQAIESQLQ
jgi:recombination protein RecT